MTRPDPTATPSRTAADALRELEVAIEHRSPGAADIDDLQVALNQYCVQARRERVPPERVVIAVKAVLDGSHTLAVDAPVVRGSIRERVVSLAIRTYYTESDLDGQDRRRHQADSR